jgi:hypothetical protein
MYKLTFNLIEVGEYPSFKEAFIRLYLLVKESMKEGTSWQVLETMHWIEEPNSNQPLLFYDARDRAHKIGLLTDDGKLNIKKGE